MPIYALDGVSPDLPAAGQFWIAPDAHIIGRVRLGVDVGIWFGTVLHGDNELIEVGSRSNVQEGAMLHTDPGFPMAIGEDVTVGHHAILHGCRIGDGSLAGTIHAQPYLGNNIKEPDKTTHCGVRSICPRSNCRSICLRLVKITLCRGKRLTVRRFRWRVELGVTQKKRAKLASVTLAERWSLSRRWPTSAKPDSLPR